MSRVRKTRSRRGRRLRYLAVYPLTTALVAVAVGVGVAASIHRPQVGNLDELAPRLVTNIYDRHQQLIRTYARERRILLEEGEVPELLQNAVVAIEDARFFTRGPVDPLSFLRAVRVNLRERRWAEGFSTITMQLARGLFLTRNKTLRRKFEEILLAVELEKQLSKQQILTLYCNLGTNLSQGNYGFEAGARSYFNKSVGELTLAEAATLAGIPQQPTYFNVYARPEAVKRRRNVVLEQMLKQGYITPDEHQAARNEPLLVVKRRRTADLGSYFSEEVRRFLAATYGTTALYDEGLRVSTTLDAGIQRAAETALRDQLLRLDHELGWRGAKDHLEDDHLEAITLPSWSGDELMLGEWYEGIVIESSGRSARVKIADELLELTPAGVAWTRQTRPDELLRRGDVAWFRLEPASEEGREPTLVLEQEPEMEGAVVVLESSTGAVRAMVGGWDYQRSEFNRVTQTRRQAGSAFKLFVYGAALENGFTAADTLFDGPVALLGADARESYSPRNDSRSYYGIVTLRRALEQSMNVTSVKLLDVVGVERVIELARRCGIEGDLPPYPSLAIGSASVRPIELAAAYATIANQGIYVEPYTIESVTSRDGRVLQEHRLRAHKAMEPAVAYVLTRMLQGVAQNGTAAHGPDGLRTIGLDLAGKTGTTDTYTDAWFAGFTPRYTILSWVGYNRSRSLGRGMSGGRAALPIFTSIVMRGLQDGWLRAGETFAVPPGIREIEIEHRTGLLDGPGAEETISEVFVAGTEPEKPYDPHRARILQLPWYLQEPFYLPKEGERMPRQVEDWSAVREIWRGKDQR
ncbi:MAG: PBP1A family penicillin-binding protein [bacterium]|nr:PBP1A family penicillin-binding protein [bacterium]